MEPAATPTPGRLDPAALDRMSSLELVARALVEGFRAGGHRSPRRGSSAEFAQHREYVPGDEIRRVDWKIYARADRLVVKEFDEESNLDCHLLVDSSASMGFHSRHWSKFDYARWAAAALAHLVIGNRDSAGLVLFNKSEIGKVPPASGEAQRQAILARLESASPQGPTSVGAVLKWIGTRLRRRGLVCVFSDFMDEPASIAEGLRGLRQAGHEPILFQLLDPAERNFDYEGFLLLENLEGPERVKVDPKALRSAYLEELEQHEQALRSCARALSIDFVELDTDASLEAVLSTYLAARASRARRARG